MRNNNTEESSNINKKVREGNSCEIKKQVTLTDSKTGIEYTIAFCDDTCENGLPHTINEITMMIPESYSKDRFTTTVEHEKIHLLQRRHPELWEAWYKLLWSYTIHKAPPITMPSSLLEKRRHNPDTEDKPFACWRDRWWSLAVYNSNPTSLLHAKTVWWDEKTGTTSSEAPPEWTEFFGQQPQDEHPHEIAAQMIANSAGNKNLRERLTTVFEKHFYLTNRG
jgi:hypothetical protein